MLCSAAPVLCAVVKKSGESSVLEMKAIWGGHDAYTTVKYEDMHHGGPQDSLTSSQDKLWHKSAAAAPCPLD